MDTINWKAALKSLTPIQESGFSVKVEGDDITPGSVVTVSTKLGRTMDTGTVTSTTDSAVHLRVSRDGSDADRVYDRSIYNFYTSSVEEGDNLEEGKVSKALHKKLMAKAQRYSKSKAIDTDEYPAIRGMEGPFRFRKSGVLYYDPREGAYYDSKKDMYLDRDQMVEALSEGVLEKASYENDFRAGYEVGVKAFKKSKSISSSDGEKAYKRVSKKHGSYWLDGYSAAIDVARGASKTKGAKLAGKLGISEDYNPYYGEHPGDGGAENPWTHDSSGDLPVTPPGIESEGRLGVQEVMVHVPGAGGDARYAETIWQDIGSYGFTRAMNRHGLPVSTRASLRAALASRKLIGPEGFSTGAARGTGTDATELGGPVGG